MGYGLTNMVAPPLVFKVGQGGARWDKTHTPKLPRPTYPFRGGGVGQSEGARESKLKVGQRGAMSNPIDRHVSVNYEPARRSTHDRFHPMQTKA